MTHEEKIAAIREKCIAANGELLFRREEPCVIHDLDRDTGFAIPFRLADVLLAIESTPHYLQINQLGDFTYKNITGGKWGGWNLKNDDLTAQSPETIDFLFELLSNPQP